MTKKRISILVMTALVAAPTILVATATDAMGHGGPARRN